MVTKAKEKKQPEEATEEKETQSISETVRPVNPTSSQELNPLPYKSRNGLKP